MILSQGSVSFFKDGKSQILMCWTMEGMQIGPYFDNIGDANNWRKSSMYKDFQFALSPEIKKHIDQKLFFVED